MKKNDSNLFYTCSLIELIGRSTRQKRKDVVKLMGEKTIRHIYHHADTLHCEPIAKIADYYIDFCHIPTGEFDNIASCKYSVPSYWEIGKVYARLIEDIQKDDVIFALIRVYNSTVSDSISYYNSDFFYQPRGFIKEQFLSEENAVSGETSKKPAIRFRGFTDAWEQRELGKTVLIIMGQSPDGHTYSTTPSTYILVQGNADLKDGWVFPRVWTTQVTKQAVAGDLIMSVRAPAGAMGKTAHNVVLGRGVAAIRGNEFVYQLLVKMDVDGYWKKLSCGSTFESLNSNHINAAQIMIPGDHEQEKIGMFFRALDDLLTLHQRKHEKLGSIKKALLEKMFPKNGTKFPEIRFSGFTDAWEQRKLASETTEIIAGGDVEKTILKEKGNFPVIFQLLPMP